MTRNWWRKCFRWVQLPKSRVDIQAWVLLLPDHHLRPLLYARHCLMGEYHQHRLTPLFSPSPPSSISVASYISNYIATWEDIGLVKICIAIDPAVLSYLHHRHLHSYSSSPSLRVFIISSITFINLINLIIIVKIFTGLEQASLTLRKTLLQLWM